MSRVIAGSAGGRRLAVPPGRGTRPTSDRAREGIFSTVGSLIGPLEGCRVLDLYAGSGALGLEALSRGAGHALLVESDARAIRTIRQNVASLGLPGAEVAADRVERLLARGPGGPGGTGDTGDTATAGEPYDLVLADPPYVLGAEEVETVLGLLRDRGWLAEDALVAVERESRGKDLVWPPGYEEERVRRYGEASVWYGRASGNP
ncbi:16S rRNA (guanine(966)-N(2))-methyltransferase RsmD [Streptosporangium sp. NPDC023963]|uniref:16S rRNA (guanine(966)-N(2))-methyltransferase RsmD n=1 Tax=Streptosporangium sp. NPDC023963 TaxID=3155608 RepID=UPI003431B761